VSTRLCRRKFLRASAAAGLVGLSRPALGFSTEKKVAPSPSERLNVAVVGVSNQGAYNLGQVAAAATNIVALCDVYEDRAARARAQFPRATFYTDWRRLLDQKDIEAVVVATPDHTHAPITLSALKAGKHAYCEKPLTHTVHEARLVAETAAKHQRVTQMGTQIHAGDNYRRVVELIQTGTIGAVREVHVWVGTSWGGGERPKETPPVPKGLHYDLWLGPAPYRPYHPTYIPFFWRRWWDFGGGSLADMACHHIDLSFWALKLRQPTAVASKGPPVHKETAPVWQVATFDFAPRGDLPAVKLTWYDGGKRPQLLSGPQMPKWGDGTLFVGDKGMLLAGYSAHRLLPEKQFAGFQPPKPTIPSSIGHHREWVEACKKGDLATTCRFGYSGPLTETVLLGNVAFRSGKSFTWDSARLKTSEPAANEYLRKEYRKGWEL
jgi:predicted dehydrogenase